MDQQTAVRCAEGLTHIANRKSFLRELATNVLLELTGVSDDSPPDLRYCRTTSGTSSYSLLASRSLRRCEMSCTEGYELVSALVIMRN